MTQWQAIFYQSGIRRNSHSMSEYECCKRIINRFFLQPRTYDLAIAEAAKWCGI